MPQSHAAERRNARDAKRWIVHAAVKPARPMKTKTRSPSYELRLAVIGTIDNQGSLAWIGMRLPISAWLTGASASMTKPGRMPANRQSAAKPNIAVSEKRSVSVAVAEAGERGRPRKVTP